MTFLEIFPYQNEVCIKKGIYVHSMKILEILAGFGIRSDGSNKIYSYLRDSYLLSFSAQFERPSAFITKRTFYTYLKWRDSKIWSSRAWHGMLRSLADYNLTFSTGSFIQYDLTFSQSRIYGNVSLIVSPSPERSVQC